MDKNDQKTPYQPRVEYSRKNFKINRHGTLYRYYDEKDVDTVDIPIRVRGISGFTFQGCRKKSVVIPGSVKSLYEHAFAGWTELESVIIPSSVNQIGDYAFAGCTGLKKVIFQGNNIKIGKDIFRNCSGLADSSGFVVFDHVLYGYVGDKKNIRIPDGVRTVRSHIFDDCRQADCIVIPESVAVIEDNAFPCYSEIKLVILHDDAFISMSKRERSHILTPIVNGYIQGKNTGKETVKFADGVINSKKGFERMVNFCIDTNNPYFARLLEIKRQVLPIDYIDSLIKKTGDCFHVSAALLDYKQKHYSSEQIENHQLETMEKELGLRDKDIDDWRRDFLLDVRKDHVVIKGLKGQDRFMTVPDKMEGKQVVVADKAFCGNRDIAEVELPDGITEIGEDTFRDCTGLTKVKIPDTVTAIGKNAFNGCYRLKEISIPKSVTEIGECAFGGCTGLEIIHMPQEMSCIRDKTFFRCTSLMSIELPQSVLAIGSRAFSECRSLENIKLQDNLISIGEWAFSDCINLEEINLPKSTAYIGKNAFYGCSRLHFF